MDERSLANGVLFYSSLYVNCVLLAIGITTGRWIFMLLILLTIGLTAYMMYVVSHNADHLKNVGSWAENNFSKYLKQLKQLF